ncbi:DUF2971 domain-containing protein [Gaetbulibacter aquiaggeris]|uniref:DUF2971 domain-containing protein n=1 Tax=Gaetbulibacter aquiaggeris TaxID=1735373 RepID=A0ABW7MKZ4_9FLAO
MIEQYEYNGYQYKRESIKNEDDKLDIVHNKDKPESVYKYYAMSKHSVDALINGYIYTSHPFELNDCLDSSIFLLGSSKPLGFKLYEKFLGEIFNSKEELIEYYKNDNKEGGPFGLGYLSYMWPILTDKFGVISMTAEDKNNLMWPHYTQEKGIQIKFNTNSLESSIRNNMKMGECYGVYPINYSKDLNPIDISDFQTLHVPFLYMTNVKSNSWQYEDEWRFIISKELMGVPFSKAGLDPRADIGVDVTKRQIFYDKNIVDEITLGHNFFTGQEFKIDRTLKIGFTVEPIDSDNHIKILAFIEQNLSDKLFLSSKKFEIDEKGSPYLKRTKERFNIENIGGKKYLLTRTKEYY